MFTDLCSDKVNGRPLFEEYLRKHLQQNDEDGTIEQASPSHTTRKHGSTEFEPDTADTTSWARDSSEEEMEQNCGEETDSDESDDGVELMSCDTTSERNEEEVSTVKETVYKPKKLIAGRKRKYLMAKLKVDILHSN